MRIMIVVLCLGLVAGCSHLPTTRDADPLSLVARLRNADVTWDGNYFGLQPTIEGKTAKQLLVLGKQASPALRKALSDTDKFVAAHVLLTKTEEKEYQVSGSHWNNLKVDLHADGTVDLHPEQIEKIIAMWNKGPIGS